MTRFLIPVFGFGLLVVVFAIGLTRDPSVVPSPFIGKPAPAFDLSRLGAPAERVTDADMLGRVSLLNVWATWCVGCRQEHATLLEIAALGDVPIYGLNWKDNYDDALRWLGEFGDPYVATGFDDDGRAAIDWGVYGAPETFLLDKDGTVLHKHIAPLTMQIWQTEFVPLIVAARQNAP
jgi:cytochrome c biogenesis protein CcmG/thiol:disulfide interchange protein DsbE